MLKSPEIITEINTRSLASLSYLGSIIDKSYLAVENTASIEQIPR